MANTTASKFSREWLKEKIIWSSRSINFDREIALEGELKLRHAIRYPVSGIIYTQQRELQDLAKEQIIEAMFRELNDTAPTMRGNQLSGLRPEEVTRLMRAANRFNDLIKELSITEHIEMRGIEANRRGRCFLSESRGLPEEYEDD